MLNHSTGTLQNIAIFQHLSGWSTRQCRNTWVVPGCKKGMWSLRTWWLHFPADHQRCPTLRPFETSKKKKNSNNDFKKNMSIYVSTKIRQISDFQFIFSCSLSIKTAPKLSTEMWPPMGGGGKLWCHTLMRFFTFSTGWRFTSVEVAVPCALRPVAVTEPWGGEGRAHRWKVWYLLVALYKCYK